MQSSTPNYSEFNPDLIPFQKRVITDIKRNFDYKTGKHEILLSGSVGSAKSLLMAHLVVDHCVRYPNARVCLARKSLPDLKDTIYQKVLEHMEGVFIQGMHYTKNDLKASINFANGSQIISRSWADRKFKKFRSLELSMLAIEELTENDNDYMQFYAEAAARVERLSHIPEQLIIAATNPDSPAHKAYEYFILDSDNPNKHVYYSKTYDNPFLPATYIEGLKKMYDPRMALRMLEGQWLEIAKEVIYYSYDVNRHFVNEEYKVISGLPIHICWDFNIGLGKPLSVCLFQYVAGVFHFFDEIVIEGQRTDDSCEELLAKGLIDHSCLYILHGDQTGARRDTRNNVSDWDIIKKFFSSRMNNKDQPLRYNIDVPSSNPRIRHRHNIVNGQMLNALGQVGLKVYKDCPTLSKGFRLTALKKGSQYQEDDTPAYQHVTTAAGYGICSVKSRENIPVGDISDY